MTENQKARAWDALKKAVVAARNDPKYTRFQSEYVQILGIMAEIEVRVQEVDEE